MKTLIKSATILSPESKYHGQVRDIFIEKGKIVQIGKNLSIEKAKIINLPQTYVSAGWIDLRANYREPGHEFKENLESGIRAAAKGGFSTVVLMPSTSPPVDNKSQIEYIINRSKSSPVKLLPAGALTHGMKSQQLSEMYDMHLAGAIAFTDDKQNVGTEVMTRALEYTSNFGGCVMSFPMHHGIIPGGMMHEGVVSTEMGVKGIPSVAEEIRLQRDIELLRYTSGRLHVSLISTAKSVELIRKAKKDKLAITCAIAAHQLCFTDEDLRSFDSNYKVLPPYRSKEDRKALINGLKDGTIDAICSDHCPEDVEHKVREFQDAEFGISCIETTFCSAFTALEKFLTPEDIINKLTTGPASVLGLQIGKIEEGQDSNLTVFTTAENTLFTATEWQSLSRNSPFIDKELRGRIIPLV